MTQAELAYEHFSHRLAVETDADDVGSALQDGSAEFVVIDARSPAAHAAAHLPWAFSYPHRGLTREALDALPDGPIVVYCWGPGCKGEQAARHHKDQTGLVALPSETTVGCTLRQWPGDHSCTQRRTRRRPPAHGLSSTSLSRGWTVRTSLAGNCPKPRSAQSGGPNE